MPPSSSATPVPRPTDLACQFKLGQHSCSWSLAVACVTHGGLSPPPSASTHLPATATTLQPGTVGGTACRELAYGWGSAIKLQPGAIGGTVCRDLAYGWGSSLLIDVSHECFEDDDGSDWKRCKQENSVHDRDRQAHRNLGWHCPLEQYAVKISQVSCGEGNRLALDETGSVWAWAAGFDAGFGHSPRCALGPRAESTSASAQARIAMKDICCGARHYAAVSSSGSLWTWGWNGYGQSGVGEVGKDLATPSHVTALAGLCMTQVSAGLAHTLVLSGEGGASR
eukprot:gene12785-16044_t